MLLKKIKTWLHKYGFDYDIKSSIYYCYDLSEECIYMGVNFNECEHMDAFVKYIKHLGYDGNLTLETIALLHELGHAETMDYCSDFEFLVDNLKYLIETPSYSKFMLDIKANIYFRLPIEKDATMWEMWFIENNPQAVAELDTIIKENT